MVEILLSNWKPWFIPNDYVMVFIHPGWCGISSIKFHVGVVCYCDGIVLALTRLKRTQLENLRDQSGMPQNVFYRGWDVESLYNHKVFNFLRRLLYFKKNNQSGP